MRTKPARRPFPEVMYPVEFILYSSFFSVLGSYFCLIPSRIQSIEPAVAKLERVIDVTADVLH